MVTRNERAMTEPKAARAADARGFGSGPILPKLARLAGPGIVGGLMQSVLFVADGWFVGSLGPTALAGVALVFPLLVLSVMFSAGAVGGAIVGATARALGAGDERAASAAVTNAILLGIAGGLVMTSVVELFGAPFFALLGGRDAVLAVALDYAGTLFPGIVLVWMFNMLASLLRGSGDMVRPSVGLALVAAVHIAASTVLVPPLGVRGSALAMLAGFGAGSAWLLVHLLRGRAAVTLDIAAGIDFAALATVTRRGLFASVQSVMTIAMALIVTGYMARLGTAALAGYGIGVRLELILIPIIFAFGSSTIAIAGVNVGMGQRDRAIRAAWLGSVTAAAIVGGIGLALAIFPRLWSGLFTADPAIAAACARYLAIVGPCYAFFGLGLGLYFASQALNSLIWPVTGAALRLAVLLVGGYVAGRTGSSTETVIYALVAAAMAVYGLFNAVALRFGPWRH